MKNIKTFEEFVNEGSTNESVGSIVISSKELSTLFNKGTTGEQIQDEDDIIDMLGELGIVSGIKVNNREQVEIEFKRGFIIVDLKHKTIEIGK